MAQVDFSNARIEPDSSGWVTSSNVALFNSILYGLTEGKPQINTGYTYNITYDSPSKRVILYTGTFTASGTGFYMGINGYWKVTNISFSAGDTYSFEVEIAVSGS